MHTRLHLSNRNLATFTALVDTLLPAVGGDGPAWTTPGSDLSLSQRLSELFGRLPHHRNRADLKRFLGLLDSTVGGALLYGKPWRFTGLTKERRAEAFRRMESHPVGLIRRAARAVQTLVGYLWVTTDDPTARPSSWDAIGYPGPDGPPPPTAKPLPLTIINSDTSMSCDVVVVGSGAGGGTAAGVLAGAGLDVVVLEAGGYHNEADFTHFESDAFSRLYLDGALNTTADGGILVLAGSTLGGGTVINYTSSFDAPQLLRREWDAEAGFAEVFTGEDFATSLRAVHTRLNVNTEHGWPSGRDQLMEKGLAELGWHVDEIPRNVEGCTEAVCGYCTMGCRIGAKRSMIHTYLADAASRGARLVTGCRVEQILSGGGKATGVMAHVGAHRLKVTAKAVVLTAGALHTPAILLRSGMGGPAAGRFLRLHPVTAVWGRFEERVDPWTGILQARYSDQFADLDGAGYGFKLETAPIHPVFPAAFLGWDDGASFKRDVLGLGHIDVGGILLRDKSSGRVVLRRDGTPLWKYVMSRSDQTHVREGVRRAAEVYTAAGAEEILASTIRPVRWRPREGEGIERFLAEVDAVGYGSNQTAYFTFHQMGSARMGSDPAISVVGPTNQVHGIAGLYVMDASCFPTA
ncbi:MAG: GMC family oxidoreductase N-terminal domain-containing protein, partial [Actinomycetota bacterium]